MKNFKVITSIFIIFIFIIFLKNNVYANDIGLTQEIYIKLCGIWAINKGHNTESIYSWGKAKEQINVSISIDLGDNSPFFFAGPMGRSDIIKVGKENNIYIITIRFRNKKEYKLKLSVIDHSRIYFHNMKWFKEIPLLLNNYGKEKIYYKISGPEIKYYKSNTENLRLRNDPILKSKVIRLLKKGEKLLFLMKGKNEKIGDAEGEWVKVLTEKNEIGWCFDYYLK